MPKISVILPIFNAEKYIENSLDSLFKQTYSDFEILAVDDGSKDRSLEVLKSIQDPRLKILVNERNLGISDSLNKAIRVATGEYLARMDADDLAHPDRFQKQVEFLEKHPAVDVVGTWFKLFGKTAPQVVRSPTTDSAIKAALLFDSALGHPTVMIRTSSLKKLDPIYDSRFNKAEDYELWTRASTTLNYANLPEVLLDYRIHAQQTGSTSTAQQRKIADEIRENYFVSLGIPLSKESLKVHLLIAHGDFGKLHPNQYHSVELYLAEIKKSLASRPALESAIQSELKRFFSAQYFRDFFNLPSKKFIRDHGLLDSALHPQSQKLFWMARSVREHLSRLKHGYQTL